MVTEPHSTKKQVVTEFRRAEILRAARRAFARCGYDATTVDTIAAEAKVAKGTIYLYYKSKSDIYHAAIVDGLQELHSTTEKALAAAATCRDKIDLFVCTRADYVEQNRDFYRIYLSELTGVLKQQSELQQQVQGMHDQQAKLLETVVAEGVAKGEIRAVSPTATALAIYDLSRGLLKNRLNPTVNNDRIVDYQAVLDLLWNGLRPGERNG